MPEEPLSSEDGAPAPAPQAGAASDTLLRQHVEAVIEDAQRAYLGVPLVGAISPATKDHISTGATYELKPGKVYDGDTYTAGTTILVKRRFGDALVVDEVERSVRLYGYDAEEMKFSRKLDRQEVAIRRQEGERHRRLLEGLTKEPLVCVPVAKGVYDAYGRVVCVVFNCEGVCINRVMLEHCLPLDPGYRGAAPQKVRGAGTQGKSARGGH